MRLLLIAWKYICYLPISMNRKLSITLRGLLNRTHQPTWLWRLQTSWYQIGARPSATFTVTILSYETYYAIKHCITAIKQTIGGRSSTHQFLCSLPGSSSHDDNMLSLFSQPLTTYISSYMPRPNVDTWPRKTVLRYRHYLKTRI